MNILEGPLMGGVVPPPATDPITESDSNSEEGEDSQNVRYTVSRRWYESPLSPSTGFKHYFEFPFKMTLAQTVIPSWIYQKDTPVEKSNTTNSGDSCIPIYIPDEIGALEYTNTFGSMDRIDISSSSESESESE